jgi:carbamoyl-phosphate synthase large subunit
MNLGIENRRTLLFTGGGGAGSEAIFRLWKDRYDLHFADADRDAISPVIPEACRHRIPWASDPQFCDRVVELVSAIGADILIPTVDEELSQIASRSSAFQNTELFVPEPHYVTLMLDKLSAMAALLEADIEVPRTAIIRDIAAIGYPCFVKPRSGRGSRGIGVLKNTNEAEAYMTLSECKPENIIVQELLEGEEYTVLMAASKAGDLRAVMPCRIIEKRGITIRAVVERNPVIIDTCRKIHQSIPTRGCYNIQLMLTEENRVAPFEINPRISTTFCLGLAAGIDPIAIYLGVEADTDFTAGTQLSRSWTNYFTIDQR